MDSRAGGWELSRAVMVQRSSHKTLQRPHSGLAAGLERKELFGPGVAGQSTWVRKGLMGVFSRKAWRFSLGE